MDEILYKELGISPEILFSLRQMVSRLSQNRPIYKNTSTMAVRKRSHCHT